MRRRTVQYICIYIYIYAAYHSLLDPFSIGSPLALRHQPLLHSLNPCLTFDRSKQSGLVQLYRDFLCMKTSGPLAFLFVLCETFHDRLPCFCLNNHQRHSTMGRSRQPLVLPFSTFLSSTCLMSKSCTVSRSEVRTEH